MQEEWRDISGYDGAYQVSNRGRVRSKARTVAMTDGRTLTLQGRILKPTTRVAGHLQVNLSDKGVGKTLSVHRLVADAFIPNPENHPFVLHWDDVPSNNGVENLRWGTASENKYDRVRNGKDYGANKTHCKNGHEFNAENTYIAPRSGNRMCRTCKSERNAERYRKIRLEIRNKE